MLAQQAVVSLHRCPCLVRNSAWPELELTSGSEALGPHCPSGSSDPTSAQTRLVSLGLVLEAEDPRTAWAVAEAAVWLHAQGACGTEVSVEAVLSPGLVKPEAADQSDYSLRLVCKRKNKEEMADLCVP